MIRVVADTNVYISALNFGGMPQRILRLAQDGVFILCLSPAILAETREVLRLRFGWSEAEMRRALDPILEVARLAEPNLRVAVAEDPDQSNPGVRPGGWCAIHRHRRPSPVAAEALQKR